MIAQIRSRMPWRSGAVPARALMALLLLPFGSVLADPGNAGGTYARVRYMEGEVSIWRDAASEFDAVTTNSPVTPGDRVIVDGGRAEVELADGTLVWLDRDTRIDFRTLVDANDEVQRVTLLALERGTTRIETPESSNPDAAMQVDTQSGSIYILSAGSFRVEAVNGLTTLASLDGVAEFSGDNGSVLVRSGQRSAVEIGRSPRAPMRFNTRHQDDFDQYCVDRLQAYASGGTEDADGLEPVDLPDAVRPYATELSYYGRWSRIPTYGLVWRPRYAGAWNPYLRGFWSPDPTGWVWVSHDPWGWAPYHYGRWDYAANLGWFWSPGAVWGGAWVSYAVGPTYIGWCPLNYYNRPILRDPRAVNQVDIAIGSLDTRGWQFLSTGQFGWRGGPDTVVIRGDRLPRTTRLVVTKSLPQFDPRVIAKRPERATSLMESVRHDRAATPAAPPGAEPARSFRTTERRFERAPGPDRRPAGAAPQALGPGRPSPSSHRDRSPATATAPRSSPLPLVADCHRPDPAAPDRLPGRPRNPALERLVQGARPPAAECVDSDPSNATQPGADARPAPSKSPREGAKPGKSRRK
jgi:hypothetical protein